MGISEIVNRVKQSVIGIFGKGETTEVASSITPVESVIETPQVREFKYIRNDSSWYRKTFERARR